MFSIVGSLIYRLPAIDSWRTYILAPARPLFRVVNVAQNAVLALAYGDDAAVSRAQMEGWRAKSAWSEARARDLELELNELRGMLNVSPIMGAGGVVATVTANPALSGGRTILIDKGVEAGIKEGAVALVSVANGGAKVEGENEKATVAGAAVVGRVELTGEGMSRIRTILDPSARVAASIPGSVGHVYSGLSDGWNGKLDYVSNDKVVRKGDVVTTSSDGTLYPHGLLIGTVTRVANGPGVFQIVDVLPAAPIATLRHVWVVSEK